MRIASLGLAFVLCAAARAAVPVAPVYKALPPGRYAVDVRGMLCVVCARAIESEWAKLPQVEKAAVDYETGSGTVVIRLGQTLKVSALLKALRRADKVANLGTRFEADGLRYVP